MNKIGTALLSAHNKTGLEIFARQLSSLGWQILASAGTAKYLAEHGIESRNISEIVGPPILGHRVVTLSREIHAALLATESLADRTELERLGIQRIDLVYVNLYPLAQEICNPSATLDSVLEKTDIGGPTLVRSAAKGRRVVITRAGDFRIAFKLITGHYKDRPGLEEKILSGLLYLAEKTVSDYCCLSAGYHKTLAGEEFFAELRKV